MSSDTVGQWHDGPVTSDQVERGHHAGLFSAPVLVVSQKMKIVELTNEYAVSAEDGTPLGAVVEVGQSQLKKLVRLLTSFDQFFTHRLEVRDVSGEPVLRLTRPSKFVKSKVIVEKPGAGEIGRIVQQNAIGKIRFAMLADDVQVGELRAENWRAWDFSIVDETGTEVARIKKTWEGLAKTMFTNADNYVVRIHRPIPDPLLSLVIASALTVDTALKQDSRGLN
jgi:uncharacterized protein YxjI